MNKIAVLGAGKMGAGIAQVAAQAGFKVIMRDLQMPLVEDGLKTIDLNLERLIKSGELKPEKKSEILSLIYGTVDLSDLKDADLVIEAVVENMAVKKQIFAELDNICPPHTILATNTSTLSITEIATSTQRHDQVIGIHFFNPVPCIKLVELVRGMETSDDTVKKTQGFIERIGKEHVLLNRESPGFIVNRILLPYINEAVWLYGEGIDKETIDQAMILGANMPIGPLKLADIIGLDTLYSIMLVFYNEFRDTKYRPHTCLSTMVRAGYYGRKSGQGFYNYE
ncbi:3-hydroxyacyl-CoA dehydrogenase [Syntrophomonas zehnderi OL-4]|uniref:3-hydroxybutyryl-CoA dehydrogenase n=1 Tax=Syntrophomonas zehnderi OL-4 TaxID=690567 RepID=A0A0E4G9U0_9FIRM|nr:3-hydroxyacyl-CoA dehydrogenase NAD-binding domain-containing protein [Syntrophomonas zehnderi]CFW96323.1 3-hydroxyacyl-CoA dehydrogenase [Syntrophomonas zehnderi OL-4]